MSNSIPLLEMADVSARAADTFVPTYYKVFSFSL